MTHAELHDKIALLEKQELYKKESLEQGFSQLKYDLTPSHLVKHAMQSVVGKVKSGIFSLLGKKGN